MTPVITFVVSGRGRFPVDMLRYDECWPIDGASADALVADDQDARREVKLRSHRRASPTLDRWASFGWHVDA